MDVVSYLGAADTRGFPLTWDRLEEFIARLGEMESKSLGGWGRQ